MKKITWSYRWHHALGWLACLALMAYALFAQHVLHLDPCPLCIFQRIAVISMGVGFFLAWAWSPISSVGRTLVAAMVAIPALVGVGVAGRHVWLQNLPPNEVPACGPGLDFLMASFPLKDVLSRVLTGSGQCATIEWSFLGWSMPAWVLLACLVLLVWSLLGWSRPACVSQNVP